MSRKSAENILGVVALRGVSPDDVVGIVMSNHSMLSKFVSERSSDRQEVLAANWASEVSMGECEWSSMLE